jgi:outer membrane lipoprotein-sorting protein
MKLKFILFSLATFFATVSVTAQTVDEIINNYFENTGGADNWRAVKGIVNKATVNNQGMDIPLTMIALKDGRQIMKFELQGKEVVQQAFDGTAAWGTNFMTMEAEKSDNETTENIKRESGDFPDPFLDYGDKGYAVELMGKETVEGTECYKIKLTKKPKLVDGVDVDNISFYFFDAENFVPIVVESEIKTGQMKGKISRITFSDYQEVEGLYFPFSITQGIKDMGSQAINFTSIELNPTVDDAIFKFPESAETTKEEGN